MCAKLFATVNAAKNPLELESPKRGDAWQVDKTTADVRRTGPGLYSVMHKGRSHNVLVQKKDVENGTVRMRIGGGTYTVALEDERTRLVQSLGLDKAKGTVVKELKAPMPGLVLKVLVKEGDAVKKNDPLLILEAMKMENVIKSTGDAVVKKIHALERSAVEKGQLLLSFEH
ncbi:MAG: biotin/lipoyl-containing protein [Flavobacteriales bacterium]